jgi:Uncharacterized conserved protein
MDVLMSRIITLTTDFGHQDAFVGITKGVILSIAPDARLVDLCHEVPPQDLVAAALQLEAALPYFPPGAIHLVVVDPGVGTERAAIAVETERCILVGPDNGILPAASHFAPVMRAVRLSNPRFHLHPTSRTFHGRDIFAPCAAHLAAGVPMEELGEAAGELVSLELPEPEWEDGAWQARVISRDHFGNLVTNLRREHLERFGQKRVLVSLPDGRSIDVRETYGDVAPGELVAYIGSGGRLEVAVRNGSAAERLVDLRELTVRVIGAI